MVSHIIRYSLRKHTITYIFRNVHGLCAQGSLHQNNPKNDFVLAYADDIEYFNRYNQKLKTEVLVVSRTENEAVVTLDECQLNQVTKFKYLGCIISSK